MNVKMNLPLLPLRDIVVFPSMVIPLFVGRDKSINALNDVMTSEKKILLVSLDVYRPAAQEQLKLLATKHILMFDSFKANSVTIL